MTENEREWNFEPPEGIADRDAGLAEVLRLMRVDLSRAQGKLTEAIRVVSLLQIETAGKRVECPEPLCPLTFQGPNTLAEHVYTSHKGPLPAHWAAADERVEA